MSPGRDADPALAPPVARAEATGSGPYDWIAEPTAELDRSARRRTRLLRQRGSRRSPSCVPSWRPRWPRGCPTTSESAPWRCRRLHLPRGPRRPARNSPRSCAAPRPRSATSRCSTCRRSPTLTPARSFTAANCEVSPDGRLLAWSSDVVGDERYGLRFRDLATGDGPARRHRGDLPQGRMERGLDDISVSADRHRQSTASGVGAHAGHRSRDGRTGLRGTRRAVRSQRGRHPLGGMVRDHRIVAEHHRGARPVVRRARRATDARASAARISSSTSSSTRRAPKAIAS